MNWNIQYENDSYPTIQVNGTREKAEETAKKRNKYNESYTITEAPKKNYEIQMEKAIEESEKYNINCNPLRGWTRGSK
jgi:hypothetical protein